MIRTVDRQQLDDVCNRPDEPRPACQMCGHGGLSREGEVRGFRYVRCERCDFTFTPDASGDAVTPLYEEGCRGTDGGAPEFGWADTGFLVPALNLLPIDRPLQILDFGAGDSVVPWHLRNAGHRVVATDLAPPREPHPDRYTGDLLEMAFASAQFDLVYSYQSFEHLLDPRPVLEALLRLTKPDGLVLVHTDMEMPERELEGFTGWWYVMPPDHCSLYRHRTFETVLEDTPHRIVWKGPKRVIIRKAASA